MKCPSCQFENPEGMLFCGQCGAKLESICPRCSFPNPPQFKFCGKCGHNLTLLSGPPARELSYDEKIAKIQRYLPKGLTEKILSQRDKIEGERKQVTVMFCDMEGFTGLSEKLGPEEAYSIMDRVYEILIHKVHDFEGTVNEMTGDGIMALFGAPIALEDAPQRAIRSAHVIHREMSKFTERMKQEREGIPPLRMRIGIHTGPVVVGTLGNDLRVEFKAIGDTVNLASRVEELAEPGSTYVTESTFRLTEGFFRFEALGEKTVKGKGEPVKVFRVIAPSSGRTRFDVSAERGLTPFVGRERELELLLDGFQRSKEDRGQAVSIVAEAGVGKSRLLYEFRKAIANEDVTFLEGRCLSYSRNVPYHPIIDTVKSNFDIQEGERNAGIREKVTSGLESLGAVDDTTLPYLLELLSVKDSGIDKIPMSPETRKYRINEALKRIVLKGSEVRPLIMAYEDLHWVDKSSEESLKDLLDTISGARVLLIFTYRPEFVHTWGGRSYHSQVNLNRLSNRESLTMVSHLLGTWELDKDLEQLVLEKTEGIPFFIEELISSLKDQRIIEKKEDRYYLSRDIQEVIVPSTIQDVIMARVDSLPAGAKGLLQTGSVAGREFSHDLIKRVTGLTEQELLFHFSVLKGAELLYERGIYPKFTYIFKHALTREVVYDSILTKRRKKLHWKIGNAIEDLSKDSIEGNYGVLAEHYIRSANYDKTAEYSRLARKKAEKTGSLRDAIAYAQKRIVSLERLHQTNDVQKKIIDARTILGLYYAQMNQHVESKEAIAPIVDLATKVNYKRRLSQIYTILGANKLYIEEDFAKAFEYLEEALGISEEVEDITSSIVASFGLGHGSSFNCEFEKALDYLGKALDINSAANNLWGISVTKSTISYLVFHPQGKTSLGYQTSSEALQIADESGDIFSKAFACTTHGFSCFARGYLEEAKKHSLEAANLSDRINLIYQNATAHLHLGESYFESEEYGKSKDHYETAIQVLEHNRLQPSLLGLCKIALTMAKLMIDEKDIDLGLLYRFEKENRIKQYEGWMRRYIAEILLCSDQKRISDSELWIKKAIESDRSNGMMWHLGKDHSFYADLYIRKGDQSKAKESFGEAIEIFKQCGADGWVEKYERELAAIS